MKLVMFTILSLSVTASLANPLWESPSWVDLVVKDRYGILESSYERLAKLAKDEGNLIRKFGSHGQKSLEECQAECDRIEGCNSIGVCPRDGCYLYDKKITPLEPTRTNVDCYTSYKSFSKDNYYGLDKPGCTRGFVWCEVQGACMLPSDLHYLGINVDSCVKNGKGCECDGSPWNKGRDGAGDWCWLKESPCIMNGEEVEWTWARCKGSGILPRLDCFV